MRAGVEEEEEEEEEEEVDFEKYSAAMLGLILENEAQRKELESSVDPSLLLDPRLERERQDKTRRSWLHKCMSSQGAVAPDDEGAEEGAG